jgi:hypothetical protein
VFREAPPETVLREALKARVADYEGTRLVHTIFPRAAVPMIRETQHHARGECSIVYLAAFPDADTCDGLKVSLADTMGALPCCSAEACQHSVEFYFYSLVDALSLKRAAAIKAFIRPGRSLKLSGYPFGGDRWLTRSTPNPVVAAVLARGPGWAGTDLGGCTTATAEQIDYGDGAPETAACWFGGGGQYFHFDFSRSGAGKPWYATRISGDAH